MPQGVEHGLITAVMAATTQVPKPLMPQGVEHLLQQGEICVRNIVPKPLMPQGVEHDLLYERIIQAMHWSS